MIIVGDKDYKNKLCRLSLLSHGSIPLDYLMTESPVFVLEIVKEQGRIAKELEESG